MMSGGSLGAVIAPVLMIYLANTTGWRAGFLMLGAVGLLWAMLWIWWFRPPAEVLYPLRTAAPGERRAWSEILSYPGFWACVAGAACTIPIIHVASSWIPTYLSQRWNLPLGGALSTYLFVIYLGLDFGFLGGGALVRRWSRRMGVMRSRKAVMALSAVLMLGAAAAPFTTSVSAAVACVFLLNLGRASWGAIFLAFNQDIAPGRVGTIAGVMGCVGSLMGALLVWGMGILSKASGFDVPFWTIGALAIAGTLPMLAVNWEARSDT